MSIEKYFERIKRIDSLIRLNSTGTSNKLSKKLNLSRSMLMNYIRSMKNLGFPIKFSRKKRAYYYEKDGKIVDKLFQEEISQSDMKKINGGMCYALYHFFESNNVRPKHN